MNTTDFQHINAISGGPEAPGDDISGQDVKTVTCGTFLKLLPHVVAKKIETDHVCCYKLIKLKRVKCLILVSNGPQSSQHYGNSCVAWYHTVLPATQQRRRYRHNPTRSRYSIRRPSEGSRRSQPCVHHGRANSRGQVRTWTPHVSARKVRERTL